MPNILTMVFSRPQTKQQYETSKGARSQAYAITYLCSGLAMDESYVMYHADLVATS